MKHREPSPRELEAEFLERQAEVAQAISGKHELHVMVGLNRVETTAGKDHAVTILSFQFADPSLPPAELCELFRFRDGKCCEIKPFYFDHAVFRAAAEAKLRATA